jgi:hypothetical protein
MNRKARSAAHAHTHTIGVAVGVRSTAGWRRGAAASRVAAARLSRRRTHVAGVGPMHPRVRADGGQYEQHLRGTATPKSRESWR